MHLHARIHARLRTHARLFAVAPAQLMPPALKALCAQFAGVAGAALLARSGMVSGLWALAASQAVIATAVAAVLRSARWWLPIHLGFVPLALALHAATLPPGVYLAAFVVLALIYWTSFRTQVPLYLSNAATAHAVAAQLPDSAARVLDIGAGTGSLLRPLAALRPDCHFTGVELAPAPWLLGAVLARRYLNLRWQRGDLFALPWADYDVVYAFLSPVPMAAVWSKACAEMRPHSVLLSNSFVVPERAPDFVVTVSDRRTTRLYGYRIDRSENRQAGANAPGDGGK